MKPFAILAGCFLKIKAGHTCGMNSLDRLRIYCQHLHSCCLRIAQYGYQTLTKTIKNIKSVYVF